MDCELSDAAWVGAHQDRVWRYLRTMGAPADVAEEVLQDALLAGIGVRHRHEWEELDAARWLRVTARNLYFMQLRRAHRDRSVVFAAGQAMDDFAAEVAEDSAALEDLRVCVAQLPSRSRRALELRYGENAGRDAMGAALGIRPEGIKSLLSRIRQAVRRCVEGRTGRSGVSHD